MKTKILVIGIDGLEPNLVEDWIDDLPNLSAFIKNGVFGRLKSSVPPVSSPAWNWFTTGCQGGKTNIFDFNQPTEDYDNLPTTQALSQKNSFWQLLADEVSVGICNLPLTYPIEKIKKGFIIPGFPTPLNPSKDVFSYPKKLSEEIRRVSNNKYIIDIGDEIGHTLTSDEQYSEKVKSILEMRTKVFLHLLKKYAPDLSIMVYTSIDRASHRFFARPELKSIYIKQDKELGKLLSKAPDIYSNIFLLSDHGFKKVKGYFYINQWLEDKGYLVRKRKVSNLANFYSSFFKVLLNSLSRIVLPVLKVMLNFLPAGLKSRLPRTYSLSFAKIIDWEKTKAFGFGTSVCLKIYINDTRFKKGRVRGEEKKEIINDIISKITKLKHPLTKKNIIKKVYKQPELYKGKFAEKGPDIVASLNEGIFSQSLFNKEGFFNLKPSFKRRIGDHSQYGFFVVRGSDIKKNFKITGLSILDIAPTILYLYNHRVPKYMDGKILKKIFNKKAFQRLKKRRPSQLTKKENLIEEKVQKSKKVIEQAFHRFPIDKIALGWTGGKDSTLLLWMVREICQKNNLKMPKIVFIDEGDVFKEIKKFTKNLIKEWELSVDIVRNDDVLKQVKEIGDPVDVKKLSKRNQKELKRLGFKGKKFPFKPESFVGNHLMKTVAMNMYLEKRKIKALITGIRWDEHEARANESYFSPRNFPKHTRVHPLLHFKERDVWEASIKYKIPHVKLYENGYRSLGARQTTGKISDLPAWKQDLKYTRERIGRRQDKEKIMDRLRELGYM